jgi:hypothetical protein
LAIRDTTWKKRFMRGESKGSTVFHLFMSANRRQALLSIHGAAYPEFDLGDSSRANDTKWLAARGAGASGARINSPPEPTAPGLSSAPPRRSS